MDELVASYQGLVRTIDAGPTAARQLGELRIKAEVRTETQIQERGVWRNERHLLINLLDPSQFEGVTRNYTDLAADLK
jgi:hypothetical protein